jgi:lipoyl(octanoyl) transferase
MTSVNFQDLGKIDYKEAWEYQEKLFTEAIQCKIQKRNGETDESTRNYLLFCEHPHVYTLGKSGKESHLLVQGDELSSLGATYYKINRGGDITYHGPGQLVAYPIFDLEYFFTDIHKYMRYLEEAVIRTIADYGVIGGRQEGFTGVWIEPETPKARKICAMGVKSSRWVTMHGIGFNVNTDLSYFSHIVPCGIEDKSVTSLELELNKPVELQGVKERLKYYLAQQFGYEYV